MAATLRLEVCAYFEPEVRAALHAEGIADVDLATFCGGCDDRADAASFATGGKPQVPTLRIGGHCMGGLRPCHRTRKIDSCFDLLLGPTAVSRYLSLGVHLLTPRMLLTWRDHAAALGLAPADARRFFAESCVRMALVDCSIAPVSEDELSAYSQFTGIPIEVVPASLDYLRLYLHHIVATQRLTQEMSEIGGGGP